MSADRMDDGEAPYAGIYVKALQWGHFWYRGSISNIEKKIKGPPTYLVRVFSKALFVMLVYAIEWMGYGPVPVPCSTTYR